MVSPVTRTVIDADLLDVQDVATAIKANEQWMDHLRREEEEQSEEASTSDKKGCCYACAFCCCVICTTAIGCGGILLLFWR